MKLYFIQEHLGRKVYHGGICNVDAEKIFLQKGFTPVLFPFHDSFSLKAKIARFWYLLKIFCTLPAHSVIIFQFPMYAGMNRLLIAALRFRKSIRIICFIADIDGIRDGDDALLKKEITMFRRYKYFIVHNEKMKQWLVSKTTPQRVTWFNFFDFLTVPVTTQRHKSSEIDFAGNLSKSTFLESLGKLGRHSSKLVFNVYGENPAELMLQQTNVSYKGFAEPYAMPALLNGSFGLVWDGNSIERLDGHFGIYQQLNSPHKPSLYILSGMPLVVHSSSALALLIKEYEIGICVNSLYDLDMVIDGMTEATYQRMITNTKKLAHSISSGEMLGSAIDDLLVNWLS